MDGQTDGQIDLALAFEHQHLRGASSSTFANGPAMPNDKVNPPGA